MPIKFQEWKRYKDLILCGLIALIGAVLRIYHYDSMPPDNWTSDEYAFAWSGMSLIQNHVPTSWSWLGPSDDFPTVVWEAKDVRFRFVTPWFDHPPLFGLIVGMAAILGGANTFFDCSLTLIRIPSLILGITSIALVYLLGFKLYGTGVAAITSLIFATNPNTVFLSRLAISENLILFLSLCVIISFLEYYKSSNKKYLYIAIVLAALAPLVKVTGIFLSGVLFVLLIYQRKWKESLIALGLGILGFSLYFFYGMIYDFEFFQKIYEYQQNDRLEGYDILKYLVLPTTFFEDNWLIFAWLTLISFIRRKFNEIQVQVILLPVLIYALLLAFSGAQSHYFAWYNIPFYPFLFLSLGVFLYKFQLRPDFPSAAFIFLFLIFYTIHLNLAGWILSSPTGKYFFMLATALILGIYFRHDFLKSASPKIPQIANICIFILLIIANINIALNYQVN